MRTLGHRILNEKASRAYVPYQDIEAKAMLVGFLERPNLVIDHLRRYTASLTIQMTFGFRITQEEDQTVKKIFDVGFPLKNHVEIILLFSILTNLIKIFERFSELVGSQVRKCNLSGRFSTH